MRKGIRNTVGRYRCWVWWFSVVRNSPHWGFSMSSSPHLVAFTPLSFSSVPTSAICRYYEFFVRWHELRTFQLERGFMMKADFGLSKTASLMYVKPRIVVHYCPLLTICRRCFPRHAPDDAPGIYISTLNDYDWVLAVIICTHQCPMISRLIFELFTCVISHFQVCSVVFNARAFSRLCT